MQDTSNENISPPEVVPSAVVEHNDSNITSQRTGDASTQAPAKKSFMPNLIIAALVLLGVLLGCFLLIFIYEPDFLTSHPDNTALYQSCLSAPNSIGCQDCIANGSTGLDCSKCEEFHTKSGLPVEDQQYFQATCMDHIELTPTEEIISPTTSAVASTDIVGTQTRFFKSSGGFSFQYPENLNVIETTVQSESPSVSNPGEYQQIHIELDDGIYLLRIVYKNSTSPVDMEIYGGAAGEFVSKGTVNFLGEPLEKFELVWEDGNNGYYYPEGNIATRGGLSFGISLTTTAPDWESSVPVEIVKEVDKILESFVFI